MANWIFQGNPKRFEVMAALLSSDALNPSDGLL